MVESDLGERAAPRPRAALRLLATVAVALFVLGSGLPQPAHARPPAQQEPPPSPEERHLGDLPLELRYLASTHEQPPEASAPASSPPPLDWWNHLSQTTRVTFHGLVDQRWMIFAASGNGTWPVPLAHPDHNSIQPKFRRGADRIAYASDEGGAFNIWVVDGDGHNRQRISDDPVAAEAPSWSPDGSRIAFQSRRDEQWEIYVMNANGSNVTRLTFDGEFDGQPAWSPDGTRIAFTSRRGGIFRILVMNADGSAQTALSHQPFAAYPVWSADSQQIAYAADGDADGWLELWLMNANGANQKRLHTPGAHSDAIPSGWSPDGHAIAYTDMRWSLYNGAWYWTWNYSFAYRLYDGARHSLNLRVRDWLPSWGSLDAHPPVAVLNPLAPVQPYAFNVGWSAFDTGVAGLKTVEVQMRAGQAGAWTPVAYQEGDHHAAVQGQGGVTYYFRIRAVDNHHNYQSWPADYHQAAMVENYPPSAYFTSPGGYLRNGAQVLWDGLDLGGSDIKWWDVQIRSQPAGAWQPLVAETQALSATVSGVIGQAYGFRIRAADNAGNLSAWPQQPSAVYTLYHRAITSQVFDARGIGLAGASAAVHPAALHSPAKTGAGGTYTAYLSAGGAYSLTLSKAGYGAAPASVYLAADNDASRPAGLPPLNNLVVNGGFETAASLAAASAFGGWEANGPVTATKAGPLAFSGHTAALLPYPAPLALGAPEVISGSQAVDSALAVGAGGHVHWVFLAAGQPAGTIYHQARLGGGAWTAPVEAGAGVSVDAAVTPDGTLHVVWDDGLSVRHRTRSTDGAWSAPAELAAGRLPAIAADSQGRLHLAYVHKTTHQMTYRQRSAAGVWQAPVTLTDLSFFSAGVVDVFIRPDDEPIILSGEWYCWLEGLGGCSILPVSGYLVGRGMAYDAAGSQHLLYRSQSAPQAIRYRVTSHNGFQLTDGIVPGGQSHGAMAVTPEGSAYVVQYESGQVAVRGRSPDHGWLEPQLLAAGASQGVLQLSADSAHLLHMVYALDEWEARYQASLPHDQAPVISQVIHVPSGLHKPTLSLWYQLEGEGTAGGPGLRVTVQGEGGVTEVISATGVTEGWAQAWADVSPWAGQSLTLTVATGAGSHGYTGLRVDDVSLGEWLTPVALSAGPLPVRVNVSTPITISGQNFIKSGSTPPQVFFNALPASSVQWLNENTLVAQSPPLPRGMYDIRVVNPGGQDHTLPAGLFAGYRLYAPLMGKY